MKIEAYIKPLTGKHYGTEVSIKVPGKYDSTTTKFSVWLPVGEPSDLQLDAWGIHRVTWDSLEPMERGDYMCDSHWQSETELQIARRIVDDLNGVEL